MGSRNVNTGMLNSFEPAAGVESDPLYALLAAEGDADAEIDERESMIQSAFDRRRGEAERKIDGTELLGASPAEIWDAHHQYTEQ